MIRIKMERRMKRERAENWTEEERALLRSLVTDRIVVIENKCTDTTTNMQKLEAWKDIWEKFVLLNPRPRTVQKLREQWKRMKLHTKNLKKKGLQDKESEVHNMCDQSNQLVQQCGETYIPTENGTAPIAQAEYKYARDSIMNPQKTKNLTSRVFQSKNGIEYKRTMLELNKIVKEQIANCAIEEHELKMEQMREEHNYKMERTKEMHLLQCENERLKIELARLEIEIRKKQLNDYVI
ncbi:uncharacterized protein LOC143923298 [Arctopsyche grandis]|uniref:uncharacterized protein LOC143923298 n=1 Tax=Arctopsyche grandis TaxID=121162 RepID=UPI00406D98DA